MNKSKLVSNQQIYLDCRKLIDKVLDVTPNFPREYKFTIGSKMHEISVSLISEITAAYINRDRATRIQHLINFQSEFEVLKTLVRIAGERKWILGRSSHADIIELMDAIGKQATAWKNSLIKLDSRLDLQGFFMSINKKMLAGMVYDFVVENYHNEADKDTLRFLCRTVVLHEPEKNCERHSPASYWDYLPPNKSLFTNGEGLGVAIGNLFSQLFANFLLNVLDWYLIKALGFQYVGRYVDDFYIVDKDKARLLAAVPYIRTLLQLYGLTLHPHKFYLQHYSKGVQFTGSVVKKDRVYTANHTITNAVMAVRRLNRAETVPEVLHAVDSINSYLGCFRHCNEYNTRRKVLQRMDKRVFKWVYIKGHYDVVAIKKKYKLRTKTLQRIRDGDY